MIEHTMDGLSINIEQTNLDKLRSVFPECVSEGKLDIDKLLSLCGEYIDNDFEKYKFEWKGKADCLRLAQKRSTGTLRPCPEESVDWDTTQNLYIEGDNLEVLKLLQTTYYRKVKMIYIDPPYNTGNDFVYADNFADPMARYKEVTQQTTKSNPETMGRYHTNWLNMMYPRLRLAANLLRDDGVIFISIDDNEVDNLKKLCNEVFGEENFVAQFIWQKRTSPDARKKISDGHEYIVMYCKTADLLNDAVSLLPLSDKDRESYKNPDNDVRGPWVSSDFTAQGYRPNQMYKITTPGGAEYYPPAGTCWKNVEEVYLQQAAEGRFWYGTDGKGMPRRKTYLAEKQGRNMWTWWPNSEVGHTQEATKEIKSLFADAPNIFDFPKPTRLLKRMVSIASKNDDIILDFFSGSATTAHAVMQVNAEDGGNRHFILVQLPELCDEKSEAHKAGYKNICEIGKERIRRAGKKILEEHTQVTMEEDKQPLDVGFRVFKLDTSNLKTWDATPIEDEQLDLLYQRMNTMIHRVKPERTDLDMIYEIMLKLGVPLTYSVTSFSVNNKTVYGVGDDYLLLVCLAEDVRPEDVEQMTEYAPAKIIISRDSFADDTAMANAYYILRDHGIELKLV
ncbi:site-specific DNA-methyltransferase [Flintibacter sp.]|uniref:site-specific DNA-methyltransferase n=1 Tax=Flintibacter sp. TaxID=1918624 RepID=UPI000821F9FF|nr:site-specific DNA-methyltransferase [Flintibacter sp.]SCJ82055.1 putative methyltransferase [uncultured Flavonifractor sp.]